MHIAALLKKLLEYYLMGVRNYNRAKIQCLGELAL